MSDFSFEKTSYHQDYLESYHDSSRPRDQRLSLISIVVPIYHEEKNIPELIKALDRLAEFESGYQWEYVLVNDGSRDRSLDILCYFAENHSRCRVVNLSRNFGKEIALSAGVQFARGQAIVCLDADLQHPPHYVSSMLRLWEQGFEVVSGVRKKTEKETFFRRISSQIFYWIMASFSEINMSANATDFRLLDRKVVSALQTIGERQRIFRGLIDWLGFRRTAIEFEAPSRLNGQASYSTKKLMQLAVNSFVSYSTFPLKLVGLIGLTVSFSSGILFVFMLYVRLILNDRQTFTPLAILSVGNTFLFGFTVTMMGLIALYIRKIYGETNHRPLFVLSGLYGFPPQARTQSENWKVSYNAFYSSPSNNLVDERSSLDPGSLTR